MKIAFADRRDWDYLVESAYKMPLGGSQSALCYLAEALAKLGHEVFLLNNTSVPALSRGVICLPLKNTSVKLYKSLDALIVLNLPGWGMTIKPFLGEQTKLILWTGDAPNQPTQQPLENPNERDVYDGIALVSNWQSVVFHEYFGIDRQKIGILRNSISPSFCEMFPSGKILPHKSQPPVLAYTSTPFRGLDLLLEIFPKIRAAIPGTRLKIFSSMKVYQVEETEDEYVNLYQKCQETEGVEYIGSIPQPELAKELKSVTVLAYSNSFPETSCMSGQEAMASGCWIVTSQLGALPETTAGFARLIPMDKDWETYIDGFIQETVKVLTTVPAEAENHLRKQVDFVNSAYNWSVRALEWVDWLTSLGIKSPASEGISLPIPQQAYQYLIQGEYSRAVALYQQEIEAQPDKRSNYWYLGVKTALTFLLKFP